MKSFLSRFTPSVLFAAAFLLLTFGIFSGCSSPATAQTPTYTVTLTLPNQNTDGSALALSGLASYSVAYKLNGGTAVVKTVNGPFTSADQSTTIPKAFGTTCANAFVTSTGGMVSAATAPDVCAVFTAPPKPPSNVTVQ